MKGGLYVDIRRQSRSTRSLSNPLGHPTLRMRLRSPLNRLSLVTLEWLLATNFRVVAYAIPLGVGHVVGTLASQPW